MLAGGIAASAAIRIWPFRIYSFPAQPIVQQGNVLTVEMLRRAVGTLKEATYLPGNLQLYVHPEQHRAYLRLLGK